jgi:DNA gyrase subunit B
MTLALQNAQLFVNPEAPPLNGEALETLFQHYLRVMAMIKRLSRQIPADVLETMIDLPPLIGNVISTLSARHGNDRTYLASDSSGCFRNHD